MNEEKRNNNTRMNGFNDCLKWDVSSKICVLKKMNGIKKKKATAKHYNKFNVDATKSIVMKSQKTYTKRHTKEINGHEWNNFDGIIKFFKHSYTKFISMDRKRFSDFACWANAACSIPTKMASETMAAFQRDNSMKAKWMEWKKYDLNENKRYLWAMGTWDLLS